MTDPFKNQRYSYKANLTELRPTDNRLSPNEYNEHFYQRMLSQPVESVNLIDKSNKQDFYQNYINANKDVIKQLKSNIELVFKGAK